MNNERPLVRFNPEAALVWLSKVVERDGGKDVTRAQLLGIRKKWKFLRDKSEHLAFMLVDALNNNPAPDVWDVADGYQVRVYPTPGIWDGGGVVVVKTPGYPHLVSEWQMFSEFVAGEELPGLEAAIEALTSVARLANGLVKPPPRPRVVVDETALRRWLGKQGQVIPDIANGTWVATPDSMAELLRWLDGNDSDEAWQPHYIRAVTAWPWDDRVVFVAHLNGTARICTMPQEVADFAEAHAHPGVDAAVKALQRVARLINEAHPLY